MLRRCTRKQNTGSWRKACRCCNCELFVRCWAQNISALYALNLNIPSWFSTWIYNVNLINIQTYVVLFCVKFSSIRVLTTLHKHVFASAETRLVGGTLTQFLVCSYTQAAKALLVDTTYLTKKEEVITVTIELNNSCIWRLWLDMYLRKNISDCMRSGVVLYGYTATHMWT